MTIEQTKQISNGSGLDSPKPALEAVAGTDGKRNFGHLVTDAQGVVSSATALAGDTAMQVMTQVGATLASASLSVKKMGDVAVAQTQKSMKATDSFARARPWQSIGIAAVAGFLAALVIARRR